MTEHRPTRDRTWRFDVAVTAVLAVACSIPHLLSLDWGGWPPLLCGLLLVLPLLGRRLAPGWAFGLMTAAALVTLVLTDGPPLGVVAVPVLVYSLARWSGGDLPRIALGTALVGSVLGPLVWLLLGQFEVDIALFGAVAAAAIVSTAYLVGRRRHDTEANIEQRAQAAVERERLQLAEQEQRGRAARVDERNRIARELHDVVAHSLSVIVVQAEGGRAAAAKRPEQAAEALSTIADTGRAALEEMRRIVGVLRRGGSDDEAYAPSAGFADITDLVARTSETAELSVYGSPPAASPVVGLTAYRVVQEALTNVLKHAGPGARARVTLAHTADGVEIEVVDDGRGAAAVSGTEPGHGLLGMQERVLALGGTLAAGPRPGGGYAVRASLPLAAPGAAAAGGGPR